MSSKSSKEHHIQSMISDAGNNVSATGYDSNSSSNPCHSNKRLRHDDSSSSVRFKGVVLQQNGHWGAQIYANHQRIWLGTFKSEKEAAMAYDSAAIKFRSGDSYRNFPWTSITIQEPNFQDLHTTESVLNMIKDGSYQSKFSNFVRTRSLRMESESEFNLTKGCVNERGFLCEQLFQKELTPSDVGKLNRLVIPKKHAIKYFPQVSEVNSEKDEEGGGVDDVQLAFFDKWMKSWKFRYCYWKSSQSFVFTRGWNRFVKEKELKAKDVITFYRCAERDVYKEKQTFCMIDIGYTHGEVEGGAVRGFDRYVDMKMELQLGMGENFVCESSNREEGCEEEEKVVMEVAPQPPAELETKSVRLFGVQISS